jgi:hypothetical protein
MSTMFPDESDTAEEKMSKGCNCGVIVAVVVVLIFALLAYAVARAL